MSAIVMPALAAVPARCFMPAAATVPAAAMPARCFVPASATVTAAAAMPAAATVTTAAMPAAATVIGLRLGWTGYRDRQCRRGRDQQLRPHGLALHWLRPRRSRAP
jgi:hypothetical protein